MSDLNLSVEFAVTCECGNDLDSGATVEKRSYAPQRAAGRYEIIVTPCKKCLDDIVTDIREQAKAWAGEVKAACARIADDCDLSRPAMANGPLKDEWEAGVADASVSIEEAILAFDVDKVKP